MCAKSTSETKRSFTIPLRLRSRNIYSLRSPQNRHRNEMSSVQEQDSNKSASIDADSTLRTWANKYRGATVADLDLPPALSTSPNTSLHSAVLSASSHDYSHLTVLSDETRSLLGYLTISKLKSLFDSRQLDPSDPVKKAMVKFHRGGGRKYEVITMDTELWELEGFFEDIGSLSTGTKQDFAVVTDGGRKFVLGVATRHDLDEFVRRRPSMA